MQKHFKTILITLLALTIFLIAYRAYSSYKDYRRNLIKAVIDDEYLQTIQQQDTSFGRINYTGILPENMPVDLPILSVDISNDESLSDKVIDYCRIFEYNTNDPEFIMAYGENCDVTEETYDGVTHIQVMPVVYNISTSFGLSISTATAQDFINQFYDNLQAVNSKTSLLLCDEYDCDLPDDTGYDVNGAYITFSPQYKSIPVIKRSEITLDKYVLVKNNQVMKAELNSSILAIQEREEKFPLLTIDKAVENISSGNGVLLKFFELNGNDTEHWDISKLDNINFSDVTIEYRTNDEQSEAIPMYHFTGVGIDAYGNQIDIDVLTPAIQFTTI